jgi:hypothetical protein
MKKILLPILLACALALPAHAQNILVIDVNNVFNGLTEVQTEIAKMKSAVDEYNGYLNDQTKVIIDMQNRVQSLQQQSENPVNTPEARETFKRQASDQAAIFESKRRDIATFQTTSNNVIQQAQETLVKTQLDKIRAEVASIAAKRKAVLVLNKANMGMISSVIFSEDSNDISNEVRDNLNKAAASSASAMPNLPSVPATTAPASTAKPAGSSKG